MTEPTGSMPSSNTPGQPTGQNQQYSPGQGQQPAGSAYQHAGAQQPAYHQAQHSSYHQAPQPAQPYAAGSAYGAPSGTVAVEHKSSGGRTFLIAFGGALLACVLAFGGFTLFGGFTSGSGSSTVIGASSSTSVNASDEDLTLPEAVAEKCLPSVAAIDVYTSQQQSGYYGFSYSDSDTLEQSSLGSGVVLSEDGYIITNYHVIEGAEALKVTVGGEEYDADIVGSDPSSDVAVIKAVGASGLTAIELGDSDNLIIGEWVMSIGSPFGLEQSVATGIVSATSRSQIMSGSSDIYGNTTETTIYPNMIQTDAAINPGNSGGALVDSEGKLIGINTLITSYSGNYSGVGFAIPVNYAVNLAQQIIDGKTPTHAQLGVSLSTVTSQLAQRYHLSVDEGAYIAQVYEGTGAADAGLEEGDIVTAFDGEAVTSASDLMIDVRSKNPGDKVTLTVDRDGETKDIEVTLGSDGSEETTQQNSSSGSAFERLLGGGMGGAQS